LAIIGEDERGINAEFSLPRKQDEFIFISRKAGTISGNSYHQGLSPATKPKIFILLKGSLAFSYREIGADEKIVMKLEAPSLVEVSPNVTHKVETLEDVILLECNSINDIQSDRIKESV